MRLVLCAFLLLPLPLNAAFMIVSQVGGANVVSEDSTKLCNSADLQPTSSEVQELDQEGLADEGEEAEE